MKEESIDEKVDAPHFNLPEPVNPTSVPGNVLLDNVSSTMDNGQGTLVVTNRPGIHMPNALMSSTPTLAESQVVPPKFNILVEILRRHCSLGNSRPLRSVIAVELSKYKNIYRYAGFARFRQFMALAEKEGIVVLGGMEGDAWVALSPKWIHAVPGNTS